MGGRMSRFSFLFGVPVLGLATAPAFAQPNPAETTATPTPSGDPILDRLNALEARVRQLEARNAELEAQAQSNQSRLEGVETRAAKNVQFGWVPTLADR